MVRLVPVLALALVAAPAPAQSPTEVYAPKEGKYTVKFPGKPKEQSQTVKTDLGNLRVNLASYAAADGQTCWVSYTDYPADAIKPDVREKLIDGVRDGMKGADGAVVSEKKMEFGAAKLPGREVVLDRGKFQIRCRYLIRDSRLFQVVVLGPGEYVTGKDATAFLDSFEVK